MRVVLDTNVVVRAANPSVGPARQLLHLLLVQPHVIVTSPFMLAELDRAIRYPRVRALHRLADEAIRQFIQDYQSLSEVINFPAGAAKAIVRDSQVDPVLQTAISGNAD